MNDKHWARILPKEARWNTQRLDHTLPANQPQGSGLVCGHGHRGEPRWPEGLVGSVTHAGGYRTEVTAPGDRIAAMGIDMEPRIPLRPAEWGRLLHADEVRALMALPAPVRGYESLVVWCLKEALFKALQGCVPLDELSLWFDGGAWRLRPGVEASLRKAGHGAVPWIMRTFASDGWQCAAVWRVVTSPVDSLDAQPVSGPDGRASQYFPATPLRDLIVLN